MLRIYTIQISVARTLNLFEDPRFLDTTVKSGDKTFAPTWKMVMSYKEGEAGPGCVYRAILRDDAEELPGKAGEVGRSTGNERGHSGLLLRERAASATGTCSKISW